MNKNLEHLHQWVSSRYESYLSMIAIGSIVVEDQWIDGRSDRDILLIFNDYPERIASDLRDYLQCSSLDDTYLFTPLSKSELIGPKNHSHDFSNKFRSKTLYGVDLIPEVRLPTEEVIKSLYEKGLERVTRRMDHRIAHTSLWDNEKVQNVFWKLFKHSFMNLAIRAYATSGNYPKRRKDVVEHYASQELQVALETLNSINEQPKEAIVSAAEGLVDYLRHL